MSASINVALSTASDVGDWQGDEALAAQNFNRLLQAVLDAIPDDLPESDQWQVVHKAWDDWGSSDSLLTLTDKGIRKYIRANVPS